MDHGKRYEPAELLSIVLLGFLLRLYVGRSSFLGGNVLFGGYDDYYHMRRILYTVNHFPSTLWFDSYLNYPHGLAITWPPLWDQMVAAIALALGQHSQHGIELVGAVLPAVIGSTVIVAIYYMVREAFDRRVAILAAFMAALSPDQLRQTMFGLPDHHGLEGLLLVSMVLFLVLALSRKEHRPIFIAASGISATGLAYTWLGASAYFAIILAYAAVQMTLDLRNGVSSKDTATTLLAAFGIALILTAPFFSSPWMSPSFFGIIAVILGILLLFAVSRLLANRGVHWAALPAIIVLIVSAFMLLSQLMSNFWIFSQVNTLVWSGGEYLFSGEMIGKIAEAEPLFASPDILDTNLDLNLLFSVLGLAVLAVYILRAHTDSVRGRLLIFVWAASSLILVVGQVRFLYVSSIATAVLISILFFKALDLAEEALAKRDRKQHLTALAIVLFLILVIPSVGDVMLISSYKPDITGDWYESLAWLGDNTHATGWYDDPSNVPEYGILCLWDYGNWILYESKRPVVANNFQAGAYDSAKFYVSEDEADATAILDAHRSKYVMTDYDMLYSKFQGIASWSNKNPSDYQTVETQGAHVTITPLPKLMNTTLAHLYLFNGVGLGHFRMIYESSTAPDLEQPMGMVKIFEYVPGALIKVKAGPDQKVGILLNMTSNQGRPFVYVNEGTYRDGVYEIRVPYSTETVRERVHALGTYLVFSGNQKGVKMQDINVSESDVLEGRTIGVSFEAGK